MEGPAKRSGLLLCVCQGTCPSFQGMDIFEVLNRVRREALVDWVGLHPQLCADDGDVFLQELLKGADVDTLYVAGCDPRMQAKLFREPFEAINFDRNRLKGVDIRNMDTDQATEAIRKLIGKAEGE